MTEQEEKEAKERDYREHVESMLQPCRERTARVMQRLHALGLSREQAILATLPFAQQFYGEMAFSIYHQREELILDMMEYATHHTFDAAPQKG